MKKKLTLYIMALMALLSTGAYAQDYYVFTTDEGLVQIPGDLIDSVKIEGDVLNFYQNNAIVDSKLVENVKRIKFDFIPTSAYPDGIAHEPGRVEAEDFDSGGMDVAFYNTGAWYEPDKSDYRDGTDGETAYIYGGVSNGWMLNISDGDWYTYTINVPEDGWYDFTFMKNSGGANAVDLFIDGDALGEPMLWPDVGWGDTLTDPISVPLTAGIHVLKILVHGGSFVDYFEFSAN
ncbi:hypothetical protein AGMMS50262_04580 [Bacteroidia bacterium]|nr:hypothetical protein AGMMS50262_04580 [Bacteroidia bacterium]